MNGLNYDGVMEIFTEVWESLECLQLVLNAAAVMFGEHEVGRMALEQIRNSQVTMEEAVNVKHLVFSGLQVPLLVPI